MAFESSAFRYVHPLLSFGMSGRVDLVNSSQARRVSEDFHGRDGVSGRPPAWKTGCPQGPQFDSALFRSGIW